MQQQASEAYPEIDEYLWPLTGATAPISWETLAENLRIRNRLAEIRAHVYEMHVQPQLRRSGRRTAPDVVRAVTESLVAGPVDGPPWLQTLKDPIPRVLRDEWNELAQRLHDIETQHDRRGQTEAR
jgi:hypothetical protein